MFRQGHRHSDSQAVEVFSILRDAEKAIEACECEEGCYKCMCSPFKIAYILSNKGEKVSKALFAKTGIRYFPRSGRS